jgi:prepilin-type processing-associated H-X9-DG protein
MRRNVTSPWGDVEEWGPLVGFNNVVDGLAHTALFSEAARGDAKYIAYPGFDPSGLKSASWRTNVPFGDVYSGLGVKEFIRQCRDEANLAFNGNFQGWEWFLGHKYASMYDHSLTPNKRSCTWSDGWHGAGSTAASSYHSGGVNVGFCDGSVRFVTDAIDEQIWEALGTKYGNETVSNF